MATIDAAISKEYLNELFEYKDGNLYWKVRLSNCVKVGDKVGCLDKSIGYYRVRFNKKLHHLHRIIFIMHHGYAPHTVDHIDCNTQNNRIENLRAADQKTNQQNQRLKKCNTSGYKNVSWSAAKNRWSVRLMIDGKTTHKGYFKDIQEAIECATKAREEAFGTFANHG